MSGTLAVDTAIPFVQLVAVRGALKLEALGLRHSSGASIRKAWAVRLGLKPTAKSAAVLAALDTAIEAARAAIKPGDLREV